GLYDSLEWRINGVPWATNESSLSVTQSVEGIYEICLNIWSADGTCEAESCQGIYFGDPVNLCLYTDCVWPGDATGNGRANNYDVLNIGLGHGNMGLIRPDAHTNWIGQYAPDWGLSTVNGVDYKHLDCNGDGWVDDSDIEPVHLNSTPEPLVLNNPVVDAPEVWLEFDVDTLVVDDNSPEEILVTAGLMVGKPDDPVVDLHGIALRLSFPQSGLAFLDSVYVDYEPDAFLGAVSEVISFSELDLPAGRIDLALSRRGGLSAGGAGRVATVGFIVVSDIIGGRGETEIPLDVVLQGLKMVNGAGYPLDYALPDSMATLAIINEFTTAGTSAKNKVQPTLEVFPNPAKAHAYIYVSSGLPAGRLLAYDVYVRLIWYGNYVESGCVLPTEDWPPGLYNLYLQTQGKRYSRKVLIEK
ncbi:MAG: T9SS type A sorting domain-containing protein, partial [Phaeodactylibacter sp.]|nr:T9SS type A sorting domain-containing protein [Phaeodactylibacter sp.]